MEYHKLTSLEEIGRLGADKKIVRFLAGGTDLMYRIRKNFLKTDQLALLDLSGLEGLSGVEIKDGQVVIGALTALNDLLQALEEREILPLLSKALGAAASPLIRNRATIGGHIGGSYPNSHILPALLVLGCRVELRDTGGQFSVSPLEELQGRPYHNRLEKGTLITSLIIPWEEPVKTLYWGYGPRKDFAFAPLVLALAEGKNRSVRIAGGGLEWTARRFPVMEEALSGSAGPDRKALEGLIDREAAALFKGQGGFTDYEKTLLFRFLADAVSREDI